MHPKTSRCNIFPPADGHRRFLLPLAAVVVACWMSAMATPMVNAQQPPQPPTATSEGAMAAPVPQVLRALPPHQALRLQRGGERETFYRLDKDEPVVFSIQGPASVQLISRALFTGDQPVLGYSLLYRLDGGDDQRIDVGGIDADPNASFVPTSSGTPGRALSHRLAVGDGWHSLVLRRQGKAESVAVRVLATLGEPTGQVPWQPIEPTRPPPGVELRSGDGSLGTYFRFNEERGLRFEPSSPGFLKVQVHSEHSTAQKEPFRYQIEVRRDGRPWLLYDLLGEGSPGLRTVGGSTAPGKVRELIFRVELGTNGRRSHYLVRPAIGSGRSFFGRAEFAATAR